MLLQRVLSPLLPYQHAFCLFDVYISIACKLSSLLPFWLQAVLILPFSVLLVPIAWLSLTIVWLAILGPCGSGHTRWGVYRPATG